MRTKAPEQRWWDFIAAFLLIAAILTAATRLVTTRWTSDLAIAQTIAFFGVIAGFALGKSNFSPRTVRFFAICYGLFAIPWQLGLTLRDISAWSSRMQILLNRLSIIFYQIFHQQPVQDSLLFLILMFILFWMLSVSAGYILVRYGDPWIAIIPTALVLFTIHSFDPLVSRRIWYLAAYLFFSLLIVARMTYFRQQINWKSSHTALPPHVGLDFIRYALLIVAIIVLFSWSIPALANAVPKAEQAFRPARQAWIRSINRFENIFASLRSTIPIYSQVYSSSSSLGIGGRLSDTQVASVIAPANLPRGVRLYWRGRTYDTFQNGRWISKGNLTSTFDPGAELPPIPALQGRISESFEIFGTFYMGTLLTPAQPLWVSHAGKIEYTRYPDDSVDIVSFQAEPPARPGQAYAIQSSLSSPTAEQMRTSSLDYPEWIRTRYLQLPESITPRTRQLATRITAGSDNPYDKAMAITNYLRNNIDYVEQLENTPPSDQDIIDWFLFDNKKGFCNYYSTAEIILLRAIGIPSRWAVGYAQGEPSKDSAAVIDSERTTYLVRQRDAHSWPEVYFQGLGWIEFEPTVSQPEIERPISNQANISQEGIFTEEADRSLEEEEELALLRERRNQLFASSTQARGANKNYWVLVLVFGIGLILLSLAYSPLIGLPSCPVGIQSYLHKRGLKSPTFIDRWADQANSLPNLIKKQLPPLPLLLLSIFQKLKLTPPKMIEMWAIHAGLPALQRAYIEINRALIRLGKPPAAAHTPFERASALGKILPPTKDPAFELVEEYQRSIFSQVSADEKNAHRIALIIKQLSTKAALHLMLSKLQRPR